jgi:hypothetical protein
LNNYGRSRADSNAITTFNSLIKSCAPITAGKMKIRGHNTYFCEIGIMSPYFITGMCPTSSVLRAYVLETKPHRFGMLPGKVFRIDIFNMKIAVNDAIGLGLFRPVPEDGRPGFTQRHTLAPIGPFTFAPEEAYEKEGFRQF